jgi:uncharacterized GH25 family protein
MNKSCLSVALVCSILQVSPASAHEFWIEPESASTAHVRVGQMLVGENLPYLDRIIRSARHFGPDGEQVLDGRQGDIPALLVDLSAAGLHLLTVETEPAYIVFDSLPEFGDYLANEGLQAIVSQHQARGLPPAEIAEEYFRYARALVQVGPATAGAIDAPVGLRYELVADTSPFATQDGSVKLRLLWEGTPEPGAQIALFHRDISENATVTRQLLSSDDNGEVTANIADPGIYIFNSVHMLPAAGPGSVVWQSHWASLSFTLADGEPSN